jgi:ABC-type transport system involved in multi-copper enzyme maturation permease subunit
VLTQTLAILLDAVRELRSNKIFWITLAISGFVVLLFACFGINEQGMTILVWTIPLPFLNTNEMTVETFYKGLFSGLAIEMWLAKGAILLALISTASIFTDMMSGRAIDLVLSKPISRTWLFVVRYLTGLLFVTAQVTIFSFLCFLVIGVRGRAWEPAIFVAIPLVVCLFSYLFAFCALLGLLTRSTVATLLMTVIIWGLLLGTHVTESWMLKSRLESEMLVTRTEHDLEARQRLIDLASQSAQNPEATDAQVLQARIRKLESDQAARRAELDEARARHRKWRRIHRTSFVAVTLLPKTAETIGLLERSLIELAELPDMREIESQQPSLMTVSPNQPLQVDPGTLQKMLEVTRERSVAWIVGTSLAFEIVLVGICCWIFSRRDF